MRVKLQLFNRSIEMTLKNAMHFALKTAGIIS